MSESLEIEYKTLLSKAEYQRVCDYYHLTAADFHQQTNCYFDTPQGTLRQANCGLRIRLLPAYAELTLKSPRPTGLLETTERLSLAEAENYLQTATLPNEGPVADKLATYGIRPTELRLLAKLTTKRAEKKLPIGLLALDESWYGHAHDYELELEVQDTGASRHNFEQLLQELAVTYRPSENKILRALKETHRK